MCSVRPSIFFVFFGGVLVMGGRAFFSFFLFYYAKDNIVGGVQITRIY